MTVYGVTAVSVAILHHNTIAWSSALGVRQSGSLDSVTPRTLFQVASMSKPVVAAAAMRLVEEGRLSLDRPANDYLVAWKIPDTTFTVGHPVLVRHLLSHTAGATNGAVGIYAPGSAVPTLLQALDGRSPSNRPPIRIDFTPGTRWRYAGGGYSILQQMLIDVTCQTFPALMATLVLDPLRMTESCYCQPLSSDLALRAAVGHDASGVPIAGGWWTLPEMAAGGLWSTAPDIARYLVAVNDAYSGRDARFMSRAAAVRMLTPIRDAWSLGFNADSVENWFRVSHEGSNNGYRSVFVDFPGRGEGIVILTNGDGGAELRQEILRSAAALYGWPGYAPTRKTPLPATVAALAEYAGTYRYSERFSSSIAVEDGALAARLNGGAASTLYREASETFFSLAGTTYEFRRASAGTVNGVVVTFADGSQLRGVRAP